MSDHDIAADDRSYLYGDGLFETVRVREDGTIRWLNWHIERLRDSASWLGYDRGQVEQAAAQLRACTGRRPGLWRLTISRDATDAPFGGSGGVRLNHRPFRPRPRPHLGLARGWYLPGDRLAEHKSTSYLRSVEMLRRAREAGLDDAISVSADGLLGECAWANILVVIDGRAWTPSARGLLPGVTRRGVLQLYDEPVEEGDVTMEMLEGADEIALLSSGVGALAAASVEGRALRASWTRRLAAWLEEVDR